MSMKRIRQFIFSILTAALMLSAGVLSSCSDDMPADSYYTFTGEMMSDYLKSRPDFSMFTQIVERANRMDLLSVRNRYTMFPPTNAAVQQYLDENHYSSVEEIPVEYCDTIFCSHMMDKMYSTSDFQSSSSYTNMLEMPMTLVTDSKMDEDGMVVTVVNGVANIINKLKNDSVENGIVHPVDHIILPNTVHGATLLDQNKSAFQIYYAAFEKTGLLDSLKVDYFDQHYEDIKDNYPDPWPNLLESGDAGNKYLAKRPSHLKSGFTVFVVPDDVLIPLLRKVDSSLPSKTEGQTFTEDELDKYLSALYTIAKQRYNTTARDMGVDNSKWKAYADMTDEDFKTATNPLYLLMCYHILDRFFPGEDKFINRWGVNTNYCNPMEWINTLLPFTTLKIEAVYNDAASLHADKGTIFLNHRSSEKRTDDEGNTTETAQIRGVQVQKPGEGVINTSQNCAFYYIDNIMAYDDEMTLDVMNARMRIDAVTLFPELTNNDIRLNGTPNYTATNWDQDPLYRYGANYYIPQGYLKHTELNDDGIILVMRPHNSHWNFGGDEVNLFGSNYNFTFRIPTVPRGTYEVRLGASYGWENRGVAQIYFDGKPQGIPIDMRNTATDASIGGDYSYDPFSTNADVIAALEDNNKVMKNNGAYRAGRSIYSFHGGATAINNPQPVYKPGEVDNHITISKIFRRVICTIYLEPDKYHTLTFSSVYSGAAEKTCFMLDYIELVPLSVCGVGGVGEDDY